MVLSKTEKAAKARIWRAANPEKVREANRRNYQANRSARLQYSRRYAEQHRAKTLQYLKDYNADLTASQKATKNAASLRWYYNNKDRARMYYLNLSESQRQAKMASNKAWYQNNKQRAIERNRQRREEIGYEVRTRTREWRRGLDNDNTTDWQARERNIQSLDAAADEQRNLQIKKSNPHLARLYFGRNLHF